MNILGISAFYHDSAACLLSNGRIVAAAQEERFTRKKHDAAYPQNAIEFVLRHGGIDAADIDYFVFYDKPILKFERLLETYLGNSPKGFTSFRMAMPIWLREKLFLKDFLFRRMKEMNSNFSLDQILFTEHHFSHAASAFYPSPFEEAVVLTLDGVGEWATTTVAVGRGSYLAIEKEIHFPHSLGLLYSAFTYYTGFKVNSGEYKLMGLAPYGEPVFKDTIFEHLIDVKPDGSYRLNQEYFGYMTGLRMTNRKFEKLFGQPARKPESEELTQFHMDVAASIQAAIEEIVLTMTRSLAKEYKIENLCLAGGVALNCVANGKILKDSAFKNVWIQPAAGDAGGALGAALAAWHCELDKPRSVSSTDDMRGSYLGPVYSGNEIAAELEACGARFHRKEAREVTALTAQALAENKAVGWFQGGMEFGPRALGSRSILGNPQSSDTQKNLNLKVKFRESFRPFAPSVLREDVEDWFELDQDSPYMLLVAGVSEKRRKVMTDDEKKLFGIDKLNIVRSDIPAVTHIDYSARVQTVHERTNPRYHALLTEFKKLTGCPVVVNTSFNVRGEPIVCTPTDAFRCFMGSDLDLLVIEDYVLWKAEQNSALAADYKDKFELD